MKNIRFMRAAVVVALLFISFAATGREWHVNNKQGIPAHFSDINAAMASADVVDGDTLYIGNGAVLGAQTINKAVTVIGTGWNFIDSPITRAVINGDITISANGAKVQGLYINGGIKPDANNIVIERCRFNGILENSKQINVLKLYSNYIIGNITGSRRSGYYEYGYDDVSRIYNKNWEIAGNIITGEIITLNMATIANNVLVSNISNILRRNHYTLVANNIIICTADKNAVQNINYNSIFKNNVLSTSNEFDGNITLGSNDLALVFKCSGSVESGEYYSLKEGSPAIGAGENGIDCGVMAGVYKFAPFGRPRNIPVLKKASVPVMPTDGKVKVSFKIENNNE